MGQVQVQPEEFFRVGRLLQGLQGGGRIDLLTLFTGAKTKTVKQTEQIGSRWLWSMLWFMEARCEKGVWRGFSRFT
jgi:hypothetical protein